MTEALLPKLSGAAVKAYMAMKISKNGSPPASPFDLSLARLSEATGLVPSVASKARKELETAGLIRILAGTQLQFLTPIRPWLPAPGTAPVQPKQGSGRASTPDVINLVGQGLRRLGIGTGIGSSYAVQARRQIAIRLAEGISAEDLLAVVDWAYRKHRTGDRWAQWSNLLYLWGRNFPAHLAAMRDEQQVPAALTFRAGEDRAIFDEDATAAAQRRLPALV